MKTNLKFILVVLVITKTARVDNSPIKSRQDMIRQGQPQKNY